MRSSSPMSMERLGACGLSSLSFEAVAAVCAEPKAVDPVSRFLFWTRAHGEWEASWFPLPSRWTDGAKVERAKALVEELAP